MSRTCTIAIIQLTATNQKENNFNICKRLIEEAKARSASIAFLPEACDFIGETKQETFALSEPIDGSTITSFRHLAKELSIWLSLGGIHETTPDPAKIKNSHLLINNHGEIVAKYCKTHLFDVEIPEQNIRLIESSYVERGVEIVPPVETPAGKVGLEICYDMRFPELSLTLAKMGANILTFPSAFTFATGASHWETLLKARAIETQCYVVAAAQTGAHNKKRTSWGHAMVVDPWGKIISQCSEGTGVATAVIDLDYQNSVRKNMPVWNHRRNDLYPLLNPAKLNQNQLDRDTYDFGQVKVSRDSIFFNTHLSIAFTNKRCVVPGHVLIAPIRQAERYSDLTPLEVADLSQTVQIVAKVIENLYSATSSTIAIQDGPEAGQTIKQVHVHILPRKPGDFSRNDDIYDELFKHDKDEEKPWRTEKEMCDEALVIRNAMSASN